MSAKIWVVVALTDEFDEGVNRHQRIFDLVGDPRDHAREELGLLHLAPLGQELLLRRQIFEDEHGAERRPVLRVSKSMSPSGDGRARRSCLRTSPDDSWRISSARRLIVPMR